MSAADPPPAIRTEPPPVPVQVTASAAKWAGIAALWVLAAFLLCRGQYDAGGVVLALALTHSGLGVQQSTAVAMTVRAMLSAEQSAAGVRNILDNPAMPGRPDGMAPGGDRG